MFSPVTEQGKVFFFQIKRKEKVKYSTPLCIRQSANFLIWDRNNNPIHTNALMKNVGHCYEKT